MTVAGESAHRDPAAAVLARGVSRALGDFGYASLTEFTLRSGRRVDVMAMGSDGTMAIVEIKASLQDFRSDRKWPQYLAYCDHFFFAVPEDFPREALPEEAGLMVADGYGAVIVREAPMLRLNPARRRAQILRFAQTAALRLSRLTDPELARRFAQPGNVGPQSASQRPPEPSNSASRFTGSMNRPKRVPSTKDLL